MKISTARTDHNLDHTDHLQSVPKIIAAVMTCWAGSTVAEYMWSTSPTPLACARSCRSYGSHPAT